MPSLYVYSILCDLPIITLLLLFRCKRSFPMVDLATRTELLLCSTSYIHAFMMIAVHRYDAASETPFRWPNHRVPESIPLCGWDARC